MANQIQKQAFDLYSRVIYLKKKQGELALELGFTLKEIKDKKLYQYIGEGGFSSFEQFLANPEIGLKYNTAMAYIRVYEYYVEQLKLPKEEIVEIPFNRLHQLVGKIKDLPKEKQIEWVEKAKVLGRNDFEKEMEEAKFTQERDIEIKRCKKCGLLQIYYKVDKVCVCDGGLGIYAIPVEIKKEEKKRRESV